MHMRKNGITNPSDQFIRQFVSIFCEGKPNSDPIRRINTPYQDTTARVREGADHL